MGNMSTTNWLLTHATGEQDLYIPESFDDAIAEAQWREVNGGPQPAFIDAYENGVLVARYDAADGSKIE